MTKYGVALFTMRELDEPISEIVRLIADAGYEGVEFVNRMHPGIEVEPVAAALEETGLEATGVHVWLHKLEDELPSLVEKYGALGCERFVIPYHPDSALRTEKRVSDLVERLNAIAARVDDYGFKLLYHPNHWDMIPFLDGPVLGQLPSLRPTDHLFSSTDPVRTADEESFGNGVLDTFRRMEMGLTKRRDQLVDAWFIRSGVVSENSVRTLRRDTPLGYILSNTDPDKFGLQVDVSFFVQQGYDPVEVVTHLSDRIETMHLKDLNVEDYILGGWPSFVDPGEGEVDFRAAAEAAEENGIEWVMIENGHSTAPLTTIKKGLKEVGVATDDSNKPVSVDD